MIYLYIFTKILVLLKILFGLPSKIYRNYTPIRNDIIRYKTLKCTADDLLVLRIDGDTCLKVAVKLYMYKSKQKMKEKR